MATTTTKLALTKPATTDLVDIGVLNANSDKLDAAAGATICTSSTRPSSPWNGQIIYETNTNAAYAYKSSGAVWQPIAAGATVCTSSTRPGTPYAGQIIFETNTFKTLIYASSTWQEVVNQTVTKDFSIYTVASQAARDALFPTPTQGNAVWRNDKGYMERYYALYNASTNPGGQTPAGWYQSERNTGLVAIVAPTISVNSGAATANYLGTVPFTAANSISLNNVFTSSYTNYRVYVTLTQNSASASLYYRYRASGADNNTANYWFGGYYSRTSGAAPGGYSSGGAAATAATLLWVNGAAYGESSAVMDITGPQLTSRTIAITSGHGHDSTSALNIATSSYFNTQTAFDGISFYASTGTITGSIIVYE